MDIKIFFVNLDLCYLLYLQVSLAQQIDIQAQTVGQAENPLWFKYKKGRISASYAKKFVGKGNVATLPKDVITVKKPRITNIPAMKCGVKNESLAVDKYVYKNKGTG